jgi:hypothetical protein
VWSGEEPWKSVLFDTLNVWLAPLVGGPVGMGRLPGAPLHQDVLRKTPFGEARVVDIVTRYTWSIDALIGLLHSSSLQIRHVLGDRVDAFERDVRERLARVVPDGRFVDDIEFTIVSAKRATA